MIIDITRAMRGCVTATALLTLAACSGQRDPRTPEQAAARGDELLRSMSDTLAASQA
jgi:hypothetical protein